MNLPDAIRDQLRERMWQVADEIDWLALGPTEKTQHYENWTKDPEVGGVLQRHMAVGQVRVYIKDSLLKDYPRARRADQDKPFRILGIDDKVGVTRVYIKPHGRMLTGTVELSAGVEQPTGKPFFWRCSSEISPIGTRSPSLRYSRNLQANSRTPQHALWSSKPQIV